MLNEDKNYRKNLQNINIEDNNKFKVGYISRGNKNSPSKKDVESSITVVELPILKIKTGKRQQNGAHKSYNIFNPAEEVKKDEYKQDAKINEEYNKLMKEYLLLQEKYKRMNESDTVIDVYNNIQ